MQRTSTFTLIVTLLLVTASSPAMTGLVVPAGLSPGNKYQLVFVTLGTRDATSSNINDYDAFVQDEAAANPALTGTDVGVTWSAMGAKNPFTVMALSQGTAALDIDQYQGAGMNTLLPWWSETAQQASLASQAKLPRQALVDQTQNGLTSAIISNINNIAASPGDTGWLVEDEPDQSISPQVAEVADYLNQNFPDRLVYTNAEKTANWDAYLSSMISTIRPDVDHTDPDSFGLFKDGLIGFFSDDDGQT